MTVMIIHAGYDGNIMVVMIIHAGCDGNIMVIMIIRGVATEGGGGGGVTKFLKTVKIRAN